MKVYFAFSARGNTELEKNYHLIKSTLKQVGGVDILMLESDPTVIYNYSHEELVNLYKQAMNAIRKCDVVLLEVSTHSLSMGYLMQTALSMGKPVIALYVKDRAPAFAIGIDDEKLQVVEYSLSNLPQVLELALDYAEETSDIRFNFFVTPTISSYLDWVAKEKKLPRSVYLRRLIEDDMGKNDEFGGD